MTSRTGHGARRGFTLPAVLAVTGVVTLIFLVAITALSSLTQEAGSARDRVRFAQAALTAEARIVYLAATEAPASTGFRPGTPRLSADFETAIEGTTTPEGAEVRTDGRPYRMEGDRPVLVRLQDQAGLINLSALSAPAQERLLSALGVPGGRQNGLRARWADYVDADDLVTPGGAERGYPGGGSPPDRPLRRPGELLAVLGMREAIDGSRWRRLRPYLIVDPLQVSVNINTMTAPAMRILFGLSETQAERVIARRDQTPFQTVFEFDAISGAPPIYDPETIFLFPSRGIVYDVSDLGSPWLYRARITLTPFDPERPFWIDQIEQSQAPGRALPQATDASQFPDSPR